MLDFIVLENAPLWPHVCAASGDTNGPMVDTHRELPGYGRVYLSRGAVIRAGRALGLLEGGEKHEEFLRAAELLEERDREIAKLNRRVELLDRDLTTQATLNEELVSTNVWQDERIRQIEGAIREDAKAKLAVVGD